MQQPLWRVLRTRMVTEEALIHAPNAELARQSAGFPPEQFDAPVWRTQKAEVLTLNVTLIPKVR